MKALASALEAAGFQNVRTYIQSGNVVFRSASSDPDALAAKIARLVERKFACAPTVVVISKASSPPPSAPILSRKRSGITSCCICTFSRLRRSQLTSTRWLVSMPVGRRSRSKGGIFYLWTPDGFADSVLRSRVERCLGVPATARNWRTVNELLKLLE